jgi:hypothetical protein
MIEERNFMDVTLRPAPFGVMRGCLGIMTLGLIPWMFRRMENRFIARMDETGFETRGGKRFAWTEVKSVRRVQGKMNGNVLSDELHVETTRGTLSLPMWRAENAAAAREYLMRQLPNLRIV